MRWLEQKDPFDQNILLDPLGIMTPGKIVPCAMASVGTHEELQLFNIKTQPRLKPGVDVVQAAEALQGYQFGVSDAWGASAAPADIRQRMVGNAFHASFVQSILRNWEPEYLKKSTRRMMAMTREDIEDEALGDVQRPLEKKLKRMADDALSEWMDLKLLNYVPPPLHLEVKPGNEATAQFPPRMRYQTHQKLHAPVMAAIREKLGLGALRLVRHAKSQWITPMFVKPKGRKDPMTGLKLLRFRTDFRAVHTELEWKSHWVD